MFTGKLEFDTQGRGMLKYKLQSPLPAAPPEVGRTFAGMQGEDTEGAGCARCTCGLGGVSLKHPHRKHTLLKEAMQKLTLPK